MSTTEKKARHKWCPFTGKCERCGIEQRTRPYAPKGELYAIGKIREYLVSGEWVSVLPSCKTNNQ